MIYKEICDERLRQDEKFGEQNHHPYKWLAILGEEVGEANKAALENKPLEYRKELIQVAAVAVSIIKSFERNGFSLDPPEVRALIEKGETDG